MTQKGQCGLYPSFSEQIAEMADAMGIALYQRFTQAEAALFLRCRIEDLQKLQNHRKIAFIQLTNKETEFFGFQLIEYLCSQIQQAKPQKLDHSSQPERILSTQRYNASLTYPEQRYGV